MVNQSKLISNTFAQKLILRSEEHDNINLVSRLIDDNFECESHNSTLRSERLRINFEDHQGFCEQKDSLYDKYTNDMFLKIERRSQIKNNNSVCSDTLIRSTAKPMVLKNIENTSKPDKFILKIAEMERDRTTLSKYFIDNYNSDLFSVPLNEVITQSPNYNQSIIIHASTQELPENLQ